MGDKNNEIYRTSIINDRVNYKINERDIQVYNLKNKYFLNKYE